MDLQRFLSPSFLSIVTAQAPTLPASAPAADAAAVVAAPATSLTTLAAASEADFQKLLANREPLTIVVVLNDPKDMRDYDGNVDLQRMGGCRTIQALLELGSVERYAWRPREQP